MSLSRPTNTPRSPRPEWLTVRETADALAVSRKTIYAWLAAGHLKADRVGPRLIRVPASELDRIGRPVGGAA